MTDARTVIAELVALKDFKECFDTFGHGGTSGITLAEYKRRKPLAWAAARAFLAGPEAQPVVPLNAMLELLRRDNARSVDVSWVIHQLQRLAKDTP